MRLWRAGRRCCKCAYSVRRAESPPLAERYSIPSPLSSKTDPLWFSSPLLVQGLHPFQHVLHMLADPHLVMEYLPDDPRLIDKVGHPRHPKPHPPGNVVEPSYFLVGVGQQGKGDQQPAAEPVVAFRTISANPDNLGPVPSYGLICVTEATSLTVSAGSKVLQVEIDDYGPVASPIGKAKPLAVMLHRLKIRGPSPCLQHSPSDYP